MLSIGFVLILRYAFQIKRHAVSTALNLARTPQYRLFLNNTLSGHYTGKTMFTLWVKPQWVKPLHLF